MEKEKIGDPTKNPAKNVGTDGLSKKERRALKVTQKTTKDALQQKVVNGNIRTNPDIKDVIISKVSETPSEAQSDRSETGPTKAQLRAERRALQEKQRQAKVAKAESENKKNIENDQISKSTEVKKGAPKKPEQKTIDAELEDQVYLFNHLQFKSCPEEDDRQSCVHPGVHPTFIRLGVQYREKLICGSNARALGFLAALKDFVQDYEPPANSEFCRGLETVLKTQLEYLQTCRPISVSITNAYRHFKIALTQIQESSTEMEKREFLTGFIDTYINDEIETAGQAISITTREKICNGDVIVTFGCSSLIRTILCDAYDAGKRFHVIVLDAKPLLEGREMLRRLVVHGIDCTYELVHIVSHIMRRATKVLFGAHALLANGAVMSRAGTSQVALVAHKFRIPILVCCETYKFHEKVQMDCFVYNEIDDPNKVINTECPNDDNQCVLKNWKQKKYLKPLTLIYDITPPEFVTGVVTELGYLPSTSVPVVLRKKNIIA